MVNGRSIMKTKYLAFIFIVIFLSACNMEKEVMDNTFKTFDSFVAHVEGTMGTKVHMEDGGTVIWDESDCIGIYSDSQAPVPYTLGEDGLFHGEPISGTHFYAFYPFDAFEYSDEYPMKLKTCIEDAIFADEKLLVPMTANSFDNVLNFKQTCGILHFSIESGSLRFRNLYVRGNDGEILGGKGEIDLSMDNPVWELVEEGYTEKNIQIPSAYEYEESLEVYVPIPVTDFSKGLSVEICYWDESVWNECFLEKSTDKTISVKRADMKSFAKLDLSSIINEKAGELSLLTSEREALIAIFNALGGENWNNKTNWCSNEPLGTWHGVKTNMAGNVVSLELYYNNIQGYVPEDILNLSELTYLTIHESTGVITDFSPIFGLSKLRSLTYGIGDRFSYDVDEFASWMMEIPSSIGNLVKLKNLYVQGVKGPLPEELFALQELESLMMTSAWIDGNLPEGFSKLKNLKSLIIQGRNKENYNNQLRGPLPDDLFDCVNLEYLFIADTHISGEISPRISNLKNLTGLVLANNDFTGTLPEALTEIEFPGMRGVDLRQNNFSGKIPASFSSWPKWDWCWGTVIYGNDLDMSECMPHIPSFEITTLAGDIYSTEEVSNSELTVLLQWDSTCPFSGGFFRELKGLYPKYKDRGLTVVSWSYENEETIRSFVSANDIPWICFRNGQSWEDNTIGTQMYPGNWFPSIMVYNSEGTMVYQSIGYNEGLVPFVENWYGDVPYQSTDFSAAGTVHTLQTATSGAGINVVLMGDAFSDRLIADGTYQNVMEKAADALFSEEPYKSNRDLFNVKYVDVVSKNEVYYGETALNTWYGNGTSVGGDDEKVFEYVEKALTYEEMDDALVIVMMNRDHYAGTCYMYYEPDGDYGRGPSIAYFPTSSDESTFNGMVSHEAGGHGFAKLDDEYAYQENGAIPDDVLEYRKFMADTYGWWKNVDFTSVPEQVKWAKYITDDRYSGENIGVYEGGATYWTGVWRPTENSIMRYNEGGFNAPSREAIWYRMHKLAFGSEWEYNHEDFVSYDAVNRAPVTKSATKKARNFVERQLPEPTPPVVVNKDWRKR